MFPQLLGRCGSTIAGSFDDCPGPCQHSHAHFVSIGGLCRRRGRWRIKALTPQVAYSSTGGVPRGLYTPPPRVRGKKIGWKSDKQGCVAMAQGYPGSYRAASPGQPPRRPLQEKACTRNISRREADVLQVCRVVSYARLIYDTASPTRTAQFHGHFTQLTQQS